MKKLISFFLAVCMMLSVPVCGFGQEKSDITVYMSDDFNSYALGNAPDGYSSSPKSGTIEVTGDKADKAVCFGTGYSNANTDMYLERNKNMNGIGSAQKVMIDFKIKFSHTNVGNFRLTLKNTSGTQYAPIAMRGGKIYSATGEHIGNFVSDKYLRVTVGLDFEKKTYDVWLSGKKRARNIPVSSDKSIADVNVIRFWLGSLSTFGDTMHIDDLYVYSGSEIKEPEEIEPAKISKADLLQQISDESVLRTRNALLFMRDRRFALKFGEKTAIDINPAVTPVRINGTEYIPLRFAAESFDADLKWQDGVTVLTYKEKTFTITEASVRDEAGREYLGTAPVIEKHGRTFVPAEVISEMLLKHLWYDDSGLCVYSDEESIWSWDEDLDVINDAVRSFIYDEYSPGQMATMLSAANPNGEHPRLILTPEKIDWLKANRSSDPVIGNTVNAILSSANAFLDTKPNYYVKSDGVRLLPVSRSVLSRTLSLGQAYIFTEDKKYSDRLWSELSAAANFPDWNPYHTLDTAEMLAAFALGYDWLYSVWTPQQRDILEKAMYELGLCEMIKDYRGNKESRLFAWMAPTADINNWRFVCNSGASMAALAIGDKPEYSALCGEIMAYALSTLEPALSLFAPVGAWEEGNVYWQYTMQYYSFMISSYESAIGSNFGRVNSPGFNKTLQYVEALNGPAGMYNFSDTDDTAKVSVPYSLWIARETGDLSSAYNYLNPLIKEQAKGNAYTLLYYDEIYSEELDGIKAPLDYYAEGIETVTMKSSGQDDALWIGFHNGENDIPHSHYDLGGFVLDSQGTRFFNDLGKDEYTLSGGTYNRYRYRAEGHNTLVINPDGGYDQNGKAVAKITDFESKPKGAYAVSNLSDAYNKNVNFAQRGVFLANNRECIIIQDEIDFINDTNDFWWFAHTTGETEISEDGKTAIITVGGKKLLCKILSGEGAVFSVMDAKPLPMSPVIEGQNANEAFSKLTIHIPEMTDGTLTVGMVPMSGDMNYDFPEVKSISEWQIEDGELRYSTVDAINSNGELIAGFDKDVYSYRIAVSAEDEALPVITADGDSSVIITQATKENPVATVYVKNGEDFAPKKYIINFFARNIQTHEAAKEVLIRKVEADSIPQPENGPENVIDGNLTTRYSANGLCNLTLDLGKISEVDGVAVVLHKGDARQTELKIATSTDGVNFTKHFAGLSSGKTAGFEPIDIETTGARYIRITGTGNVTWTSICEVYAYKYE